MADKQTEIRKVLAERIAGGLAGWQQLQAAQGLLGLEGEDTAQSIIAQIINADGRYVVQVSQRPTNWPTSSKLRMDISLTGTSTGATGWYGGIEVKWPGESVALDGVREAVVQDACRLLAIDTQGLNAKFLVLGGSEQVLTRLFDTPHPRAADSEAKRAAFQSLFARTSGTSGSAKLEDLKAVFADAEKRVPSSLTPVTKGRVKCYCLASADAEFAGHTYGRVYVWQIQKTSPGKPKGATAPTAADATDPGDSTADAETIDAASATPTG